MRHSIRKEIRRFLCFSIAMIMILTSMPVHLLAAEVNYNNLSYNKSKIINNKTPVKVAKLETGNTAADLIKNPDQPAIYTLRTDYKVQRGEKYRVDYQPYIASVGEAATQAEKDKVNKTIKLPDISGYIEPEDDFTIDYDTVKNAAEIKDQTGDATNGIRYQANEDFRYKARSNQITIKHVFQDLEDFTKYTNPDGSVGKEGELITTQNGNTGSTMEVSPLTEKDSRRKGFVPERESIIMQVPENAENFILEYRYNRAHYDVTFDTQGGTEIPARTLYYEQVIPKIADESIPTKVGGEFQGWKPSVDLTTKDGKTFKSNEIIKAGTDAIKNLDANLIMPASKVTFTAVWKDKDKADYAVQFWAEKADHADGASLADKYDYIGTRVYKNQDTGSRPDLANEPVKDIVFPDLDKARLKKIWANARFNRGKDLYLNKFYVYNKALTNDQNKDPANVNLVKSVDSTGKTVYNIYYDRQVYDLYFTKSNALPAENTFYPDELSNQMQHLW
ncbi:InlB B-repeat-containing protein [Peptostreptococcus anaerobius]|uniref:InlB B-repeat-containing protein n=1 Tax=Peptostreptococcus anaerobius TaxID=1261 RepID=UPI00356B61F1